MFVTCAGQLSRKKFESTALLLALMGMFLLITDSVRAQDGTGNLLDTITVIGEGNASGMPDIANIDIGVEILNPDIGQAFAEANRTIAAVIAAMVNIGIAQEDTRTSELNVFTERGFEGATNRFRVSNRVNIIVRDIDLLGDVINAAVQAGANNVFGLSFDISNSGALERRARRLAMRDARRRAEQLAELINAELGDVVRLEESLGGVPFQAQDEALRDSGGGAVIEPGQLSVGVQLQVTFRINR